MKLNKKQLMAILLSFTMAFSSAGCSANKDNDKSSNGAIFVNDGFSYLDDEGSLVIDQYYHLKYNNMLQNKIDRKSKVGFDYLIDLNYASYENNSNESYLAKVLDENNLSNRVFPSIFEKDNICMTSATFQVSDLILPEAYKEYGSIGNLTNAGEFDFKCQKILIYCIGYTDIVYNMHQKVVITKSINRYNQYYNFKNEFKEGDTIQLDMLFRFVDGKPVILASKQTGVGSECENVQKNNIGNYDEVIKPVKDTKLSSLLGDNIYSSDYIYEVLDTYSGTNMYQSSENEGKDFSGFKK